MTLWDIDDLLGHIGKNSDGEIGFKIRWREKTRYTKGEDKNEKFIYFAGKDKEL